MLSFERIRSEFLFLFGAATMLFVAPASGQQPGQGYYTYRYGHNPGYYGSCQCPRDTGAKLGQASRPESSTYWFKANPTPAPPARLPTHR